ncbi:hypothetical protein E1B28_002214 [Marasmius oreades]|uniref:DUF7702 domain-containing protein n=1 Tax=Marasmius oreades TaxID=181124 RepID=A0A9P7RME5_9AGAR|nr:uncharacterized protein E1B28_002214 [Marasmius oreades]KAG7086244.1 hypothetical protein E1B28_002214 [Marasmius oreades]
MSTNYAQALGIRSVAPAVIFAILYFPLIPIFMLKLRKGITRLPIVLSVFCTIRVAVFIIRAIVASSSTVGNNIDVLIAEAVLVSIGFFGLLFGAYGLVVDRLNLCAPAPTNPLFRLIRNQRVYHLIALVAVILSIVASTNTTSSHPTEEDVELGKTLKEASTIIFLILTVLQTFQTITLVQAERSRSVSESRPSSFGSKYVSSILLLLSCMLLVREVFSTATMTDPLKANNEKFWYPLVALPEFICAVLYAVPGVIPDPDEVKRTEESLRLPIYSGVAGRASPSQ